jgi:DNA-directed RNA polymerase specialized sigma subunit
LEKVAAVCDRYEEGLSDVRGCLSEKEWTVIEMLYVLDYTESYVAQLCQVSRQAVNKTKNRALAKLRERVARGDGDR